LGGGGGREGIKLEAGLLKMGKHTSTSAMRKGAQPRAVTIEERKKPRAAKLWGRGEQPFL